MSSRQTWTLLLAAGLGLMALSGCPLSFEKEETENASPTTFFLVDQPDTTFSNEMFYNWDGTDPDTDVVAFQYQLVKTDEAYYLSGGASGTVLESIDPRNFTGAEQWSDRTTDVARTFANLLDGFYELRVRAIDSKGVVDSNPAKDRVYVFFDDIAPEVVILLPVEGRLFGDPRITFTFDATDASNSTIIARENLEYSYQLRATSLTSCNEHLSDTFTDWVFFPDGNEPVTVGETFPTIYNDLITINCTWDFTVRVRDPAGNIGSAVKPITQVGN